MTKKLKLLIVCIIATCLMANTLYADEPQQSTTGPTPPIEVLARDIEQLEGFIMAAPPTSPVVIPGVPNYLWRHGCGPTAVGHVVGYYDGQGYSDLITGNASVQTNDVNQAMASGGDSTAPYPAGSEQHYEDYAVPEDASPVLLTDDYITAGRTPHTDDCIGDYQDTSKSTRANYYGWSWSNDIGPSFVGYVNQQNATYSPTYKEYSPVSGNTLTWAVLKNEIDNGRPMVFLVDTNGNGSTDHFVVVVGYDAPTNQYGCHDSWDNTKIRWETFQPIGSGNWSIWGGWSFSLGQITKWEQPPDTTDYGMDIRCDRNDGIQRVLADDFLCTQRGSITKIRFWGSWLNDFKAPIQNIHLSIHSDDPVGPGGTDPYNTYSKPDQLLWSRDFNSTEFTETLFADISPDYEWFWDPTSAMPPIQFGDHQIWQYEITINSRDAFIQDGNDTNPKVYWLDVYVDLATVDTEFGWKTSMTHWNDDAVWSSDDGMSWNELRYPPQHYQYPDSIDLAFAIITGQEEEPNEPVEEIKYIQLPDLTPNGIDIRIDDADGVTRHIADDFPCNTPGLITDIHFWGSWKYDEKGQINAIVASIYSDDPVGPNGTDPDNEYSKPDQLLWQQTFYPGQFTETLYKDLLPEYEWWWDPYYQNLIQYGDHQVWQYDIYIDPRTAFYQDGNTTDPKVYWLALEAQLPYGAGYEFGWKTSEEHWNDDAVFATGSIPPYFWKELRYPFGHPYYYLPEDMNSIDMAFAITTGGEPEPEVKWLQEPDLSETGLDVFASDPLILADDFLCTKTTLITDITVWGSWKNDILPPGGPNDVTFTLSIHSDIPDPDIGNPDDWSMPGDYLWVMDVRASNVTIEKANINEGWWDPRQTDYIFPGDHVCWKYTFRIDPNYAFCQEGDPCNPIVYWLDVQAHPNDVTGEVLFGWKSSLDHWNDDAVWTTGVEPLPAGTWWNELRYPPQHELYGQSIDLAFAIDGNIPCEPNIPEDPNLKYLQRPDKSEYGVDIRFDRNDGIARTLADDFLCTAPGKITDVHLWCSWLNDIKGNIDKIHLSIHDDIPAPNSPTGYSMPGTLLWERDFTPADFNETLFYTLPQGYEWWLDPYIPIVIPMGDRQIWRYDIYIPYTQAFRQTGSPNEPKVYWLDAWVMLSADSPPEAQIGWKTSIDHWNDAAVYEDPTGLGWINLLYPINHPYEETNVDMAFAITTMPDCLKQNVVPVAEWNAWVQFGKPDCWCYRRQCRGDINGTMQTPYWVYTQDLALLKDAYGKLDAQLTGNRICADINHSKQIPYRVYTQDLAILKSYYGKLAAFVPCCDLNGDCILTSADKYLFWTN